MTWMLLICRRNVYDALWFDIICMHSASHTLSTGTLCSPVISKRVHRWSRMRACQYACGFFCVVVYRTLAFYWNLRNTEYEYCFFWTLSCFRRFFFYFLGFSALLDLFLSDYSNWQTFLCNNCLLISVI